MIGDQQEKGEMIDGLGKTIRGSVVTIELNGIRYKIIALGGGVNMSHRTSGAKELTRNIYMYILVILR